jgi:four helix bundle protein
MAYKFEQLDVWQMALEYVDLIYDVSEKFPRSEEFNLKSQIRRAATSIALNIAEGSTGQSDAEQARFLGMSIRSLIETIACIHIVRRRNFLEDKALLDQAYEQSQPLAKKLQSFRKALSPSSYQVREDNPLYDTNEL